MCTCTQSHSTVHKLRRSTDMSHAGNTNSHNGHSQKQSVIIPGTLTWVIYIALAAFNLNTQDNVSASWYYDSLGKRIPCTDYGIVCGKHILHYTFDTNLRSPVSLISCTVQKFLLRGVYRVSTAQSGCALISPTEEHKSSPPLSSSFSKSRLESRDTIPAPTQSPQTFVTARNRQLGSNE